MDESLRVAGAERTPSRKLMIALYVVVTLLYWISLYLYMPTLPTYAEEKSGSLALVGVILAQFGLWQALARLPVGIASDWAGRRKPFILAGILFSGLGALVMGRADGASAMMIGRGLTGLACAAWVPLTVVFGGLFPASQAVRATSILMLVTSIGRAGGTTLTGSLNEIGGYPLAYFLAAGIAVLAALVLLPIPETARRTRPPSVGSLRTIITRRDVVVPALLQTVAQHATWGIPLGFVAILARDMGASNVAQSALMSLNLSMNLVGSLASAAVAARTGSRPLAATGIGLLVGGLVLAGLAPSLAVLFLAQAIMGLAQGVSYPVLMGMSIEHVQDAERATAMGLHQSVYAIGMFSGAWLAGLLAERMGIQPMILVTAVGVVLLAAALLRLLPRSSGAS